MPTATGCALGNAQLRLMTFPTQTPDQATKPTGDERFNHESRLARTPWWWFVTAGAVALMLGLGFIQAIQLFARPLSFFLLGVAIAASLGPLVKRLERWLPRTLAVVILYLLLILLLIGIGWIIFPPLLGSLQAFSQRLPELLDWLQRLLARWGTVDSTTLLTTLTTSFSDIGLGLLTVPLTIYSVLINGILILFISLYALVVAPGIHTFILSLWPENRRKQIDGVLNEMSTAMGGYVRGAALGGLIIGVCTYIGLLLIRIDFPLVLAVLAGVLEIVPLLGPIITGIVIVLVALLQSSTKALIALIFVIALQQTEGHLVFPNIMGRQTEMSPLLSIVAFVAGSAAGGLLGALVAIPVAAALHVFVMRVVAPMIRRWTGAETPKVDTESI
ncbi:MAG: AI-2E family transporter [Caldilineaceae bacterium]